MDNEVFFLPTLTSAQIGPKSTNYSYSIWFNPTTQDVQYTADGVTTFQVLANSDGSNAVGDWTLDTVTVEELLTDKLTQQNAVGPNASLLYEIDNQTTGVQFNSIYDVEIYGKNSLGVKSKFASCNLVTAGLSSGLEVAQWVFGVSEIGAVQNYFELDGVQKKVYSYRQFETRNDGASGFTSLPINYVYLTNNSGTIGGMIFDAQTDINNRFTYASITTAIQTNTTGLEDATIVTQTVESGTLASYTVLDGNKQQIELKRRTFADTEMITQNPVLCAGFFDTPSTGNGTPAFPNPIAINYSVKAAGTWTKIIGISNLISRGDISFASNTITVNVTGFYEILIDSVFEVVITTERVSFFAIGINVTDADKALGALNPISASSESTSSQWRSVSSSKVFSLTAGDTVKLFYAQINENSTVVENVNLGAVNMTVSLI